MLRSFLALTCVFTTSASAAPQMLTQTGRLLDSSGVALNGTESITFELVNASDVVRFAQTTTVPLEDGFYSVQLGAMDSSILAEDLDVRMRMGATELGRQTLTAVPYALSVDGSVRVGAAPADCSGLAGQLRYAGGALQVCNGTSYEATRSSTGVVGFSYAQSTNPGLLSGRIPSDNTVPTASEGAELFALRHTAQSTSNLLLLEGTVVWAEPSNNSNVFAVTLFRGGVAVPLAVTGDSSHNNNGGCGYPGGSYNFACTTSIRVVIAAPSNQEETYRLRAGSDGNNFAYNRGSNSNQFGGSSLTSSFTITEMSQ